MSRNGAGDNAIIIHSLYPADDQHGIDCLEQATVYDSVLELKCMRVRNLNKHTDKTNVCRENIQLYYFALILC